MPSAGAPRGRGAALAAVLLGVGVMAAVLAVRGRGFWEPSEGVYALTSRELLHGADVYGGVVAAQPPPLFLLGAGLLAVHDGMDWLRVGMGLLQLAGGLLGARVVWRLTGRGVAAALTAPLALAVPWAVHDAGALTPELLAAPLLLGGVLLAQRPEHAASVGVLAALCAFTKVPYLLPAVVLVACCPDRARAARWAVGALALAVGVSLAVFGDGLWRDVVTAQSQSGYRGAGDTLDALAQAGWTLVWLLVPAAAAWALRAHTREPRLVSSLAAVALAMAATLASVAKDGTGLNVVVPVEALLVPLAATGVALSVAATTKAPATRARLRTAGVAGALAVALAQGAVVLARTDPGLPFLRPGLHDAYGAQLTGQQVDRAVAAAATCGPDRPYSGIAYLAFRAHRRMPAEQPDGFLTAHAAVLAVVRARVLADVPTCP